jgi:uncharacterized protein YjbI with pentapeptide repeats
MIEIKNRWTGEVIRTVDAETLTRADLTRADLSWADLSRADLSRASLSRADLSWADLSRADLSRASLYGADLYGADLYGADLSRANLSRASLYGADLSRAIVADDHTLVGNRPMLQLGPLGSRSATLIAFRTDKGLMVRTGCFFGTADQFVDAVRKTHEDSTHAADYMAALDFIRNWFARTK